ncbi:MAG: ABC transporter ATP-binding protein [Candidatus Thorarchaeota archaeon]
MTETSLIIQNLTNTELIELAGVLKIPLTKREISRDDLIVKIKAVMDTSEHHGQPDVLTSPAIKLTLMRKVFGKKVAVSGLQLEVNPGEIVGLVGPNGAGKTTTLRVLTGIIKPTQGTVLINGHDMKKDPIQAKHRIGYIPERPTCYPSLRVREYLTFIARIYGVYRDDTILRIHENLDLFQLNEFANSYIGTLSKGNLQRTLLAGIFIRDAPHILAFDEPIYGLDPRGAWSLKAYLKKLRDSGSAILISTHILEVAQGLCDRFVIMNHGEVVGEGTLENLLSDFDGIETLEEVFLMLTGGIPE